MKTIALFGPTGMLGSAVYGVLKKNFKLILLSRDEGKLSLLENTYGGVHTHRFVRFDVAELYQDYQQGFQDLHGSPNLNKLQNAIGEIDGVVNAVGITNRYSQKDPAMTFFVNGAFPHLLAALYGPKLIHITTDCAFSGVEGAPYTEESSKSPNDLYGLSKAIGEPSDRSLVLRTSIIGPEIAGFVSLLEWVRKQREKTVHGYTQHLWNGITTVQFGNIAETIFSNRSAYPDHGLFHIFSTDITKYEMVRAIAAKYDIAIDLVEDNGPKLDRRLRTVHELNAKLQVPSFGDMLAAL